MSEDQRIRVLTIDDHPLLLEGIATVIRAQADMDLVGQAATAGDGLRRYRALKPDVTLMDLRLPDMSGIDALIAIRGEFVNARIVILTTFQGEAEIKSALAAGARGFLLKTTPPDDIVACIRQVHQGKRIIDENVAAQLAEFLTQDALTPRELEVLKLVATGYRNRDVGDLLSISEDTVKVHVKHIMEKLAAGDRTEAVVIALRRGIIQL